MFVRLLGVGDLFTGIVVALSTVFPKAIILIGAKWLIIKGGFFALTGNMASFIDVFFGIYVIFLAFGYGVTSLTVVTSIWVLQKAIFSLIRFG